MPATLVIGCKNYSSWSLRAWMFLRHAGVQFTEHLIHLDTPGFAAEIARFNPALRVPVFLDGEVRIWDSLAICEHVAESTGRGLPREPAARGHARSISAEMHSGFQALRDTYPFHAAARNRRIPATPALLVDIRRIDAMWADCRARYGANGPWLFGDYSIADAMYAPVVSRFNTYGAELAPASAGYLRHALADPILGEWLSAAAAETHRLAKYDTVGL